jgi:phosphopantothenoylcysteine decarboxylase/phosphopantothenate--cysteine ligase
MFLVGFKAKYDLTNEGLIRRSYDHMIGAGMDMIVANDVIRRNTGFGTDPNECSSPTQRSILSMYPWR